MPTRDDPGLTHARERDPDAIVSSVTPSPHRRCPPPRSPSSAGGPAPSRLRALPVARVHAGGTHRDPYLAGARVRIRKIHDLEDLRTPGPTEPGCPHELLRPRPRRPIAPDASIVRSSDGRTHQYAQQSPPPSPRLTLGPSGRPSQRSPAFAPRQASPTMRSRVSECADTGDRCSGRFSS